MSLVTSELGTLLQVSLPGYAIERELGGGGMSRVFAAVETALDRRVVIKVLSPELAAGVSSRRFAREIRLAASLQQANIVPVLSAGEVRGMPYYTMPLVEGLSLRARVAHGPLPIADTVGVMRDVARALAYAHEHGVVHRDIKADNVLLSGAAAVVTDFGIAKAISDSRTEENRDSTTVTQAGTVIGTPAYMAPEQIAADPEIDHRADLYSFGCLAYELLTGETPFADRRGHQMMAHLSEQPIDVSERRPDCPDAIARIVMRCLEKDPADRPQSAAEILRAVDDTTTPGLATPRLRDIRRQKILAAAAALIAVAGVATFTARGGSAGELSVAVLPFAVVGGDSAQQYIADGLADELATALGKVDGIRVVSRTLSYRYSGRDVDAGEVGRALTADYVLHGTLRRFGEQLRVSAQLTRADDDREYWSDSYGHESGNVLAMHNRVTQAIVGELRQRLGRGPPAGPDSASASVRTADPQAYDLYLRGRFLLARRGPGVGQAVDRFERAIEHDPDFPTAHAGLAVALELLPYFSNVRAQDVRERAMASARRALELDSTIAEAHTALGLAHMHAYEWALAGYHHRRAVDLDPTDAPARIQYARYLHYTGDLRGALEQFERARNLDPYSGVASGWYAHLLELCGRRQEALTEFTRALEIDSLSPPTLVFVTEAHLEGGDTTRARLYARRLATHIPSWRVPSAYLEARLGNREPAMRLVPEIEAAREPGGLLMLLAGLGDTARLLDEMDRATDAGDFWPTYSSLAERQYDPLRRSARFAAIIRRVGLDDRIFTAPGGGRPQ